MGKRKIINIMDKDVIDKNTSKRRKINELYNSIFIILLSAELFGALHIVDNALKGKYDNDKTLNYIFNNIQNLYTEEVITYEEILIALSKNDNLSDNYKNEILKYMDAISENYKYISKRTLLERLSTLKVLELYGMQKENSVPINFSGTYSFDLNEIKLYEKDDNYGVFAHELFHAFGSGKCPLGRSLYEGTNELFRSEYSNKVTIERTYINEKMYSKLLMEIIGTEPFKYLEFRHDISYIINALNSIIPDETLAYETISLIDKLTDNYNYIGANELSREEYVTINNDINVINSRLYTIISDYYLATYNRTIESDNLCMSYLKEINNGIKSPEISYDNSQRKIKKANKAYFSKTMINEFGNGIYELDCIDESYYQYVGYDMNEAIEKGIVNVYYDKNGEYQLEMEEGVNFKYDLFIKWTYVNKANPPICIKINETNRYVSNVFTLKLKRN